MRVLFLTWGEVPRLSSVYGGQVVEVVAALQKRPEIERASLLAGYPVIHSGMAREKWNYRKQLNDIREMLGAPNFSTRRIPVPPVGIYPKPWQLPMFTFGHHAFLAKKIRREGIDVVQCRSYLATHFALETRDKFDLDVKVVFDARSLMPEEAALVGRWSQDDAAFHFWKAREKDNLAQADLTIAVSQPMLDRYAGIGLRRGALILLNVAVEEIREESQRDISRLAAGEPVIAYCGYLDEKSWHDPANLWEFFASFRRYCPGARLLVITKSRHKALLEGMQEQGFGHLLDAVTLTSAPSPREAVKQLQSADISVLSYNTPVDAFAIEMAEPSFGTKVAEYLSVGLPVAVNRYCGGARDYVLRRNSGIGYDPVELLSEEDVNQLLNLARDRTRISAEARSDFGLEDNAKRLAQHYQDLLS